MYNNNKESKRKSHADRLGQNKCKKTSVNGQKKKVKNS